MVKRGRKESIGEAIEQLQKMKNKARAEHARYKEAYVTDTINEARSTVKRLSTELDALQDKNTSEEAILKTVDKIFSILMESHRGLDSIEDSYTFYRDLDSKFND